MDLYTPQLLFNLVKKAPFYLSFLLLLCRHILLSLHIGGEKREELLSCTKWNEILPLNAKGWTWGGEGANFISSLVF